MYLLLLESQAATGPFFVMHINVEINLEDRKLVRVHFHVD